MTDSGLRLDEDLPERGRVRDVGGVEAEMRMLGGAGDVAPLAGGGIEEIAEGIDGDHPITPREQRLDDVAADESRAPGDQYSHALPYPHPSPATHQTRAVYTTAYGRTNGGEPHPPAASPLLVSNREGEQMRGANPFPVFLPSPLPEQRRGGRGVRLPTHLDALCAMRYYRAYCFPRQPFSTQTGRTIMSPIRQRETRST